MPICPKCKSEKAKFARYRGINLRKCPVCKYDESVEFESEAGEKGSQKAKARYTPYRTGGPKGKR